MRGGIERREGYGHFIDWIIRIGDLVIVNLFSILVYYVFSREEFIPVLTYNGKIMFFLLGNLAYFVNASVIRINLSNNVVYFDKIIQNSFYFIVFYLIFYTAGVAIFKLFYFPVIPWTISCVILILAFIGWRVLFRLLLKKYRRRGGNYKQVIIVGGGPTAVSIFNVLKNSDYGYRILGYYDDEYVLNEKLPPYLGKIADIDNLVLENSVDEMYCAVASDRERFVNHLMALSEKHMVRFYLVPEYYKYVRRRMMLRFLNNIPLMSLRSEPLEYSANRLVKRAIDVITSLFVLITIFPIIFLIFGLIIKLTSSGPIFFKQKRTGIHGKEFFCYKFRSMQMNAEANLHSATKKDPRITKVGAFMRKTSIDEFPQFLNVLKGDMSVVGPRPHMLKHTEEYSALISKFMVRHLIKPGITGWAQVSGCRGETKTVDEMEERVEKDMWYIENWTPFLDLKIIFLTIVNVFRGEDKAY